MALQEPSKIVKLGGGMEIWYDRDPQLHEWPHLLEFPDGVADEEDTWLTTSQADHLASSYATMFKIAQSQVQDLPRGVELLEDELADLQGVGAQYKLVAGCPVPSGWHAYSHVGGTRGVWKPTGASTSDRLCRKIPGMPKRAAASGSGSPPGTLLMEALVPDIRVGDQLIDVSPSGTRTMLQASIADYDLTVTRAIAPSPGRCNITAEKKDGTSVTYGNVPAIRKVWIRR